MLARQLDFALVWVQARVRRRILAAYRRHGVLDAEAAKDMAAWAHGGGRLIARISDADPLRCRRCGGSMQLIAFITERAVIVRILDHLGEPSRAPRMAPIRGPPHGSMPQRDDPDTRRSRQPDPPTDVMPDYENQNQDLVW